MTKAAVDEKIKSIKLEFVPNIEGMIYNFARVAISETELKAKEELIFSPTVELNEPQESKKTVKIEFIKSYEIDESSPPPTSVSNDPLTALNRVKSNPRLSKGQIEKPDPPKRLLTPEKFKSK
jgi:hypothetical protein